MNRCTAPLPVNNIVALHGFGTSAAIWQPLMAQLTPPLRIEALDLPGHGGARAAPADLTLGGMTKACVRASSAPAIWLGWSLGGLVALSAATRFPQKVLGVITVAISPRFLAAPDWPNALDPKEFVKFETLLKRDHGRALERFYALQSRTRSGISVRLAGKLRALGLAGRPRPGVLAKTLSILGGADLRDDAAALSCPLMSVLGEDDVLVPYSVSRDLERLNSGWRTEVIAAAGHVPFLSHPDEFLSLVNSFVQALNADRGV